MKRLLEKISHLSIVLGDGFATDEQLQSSWLGFKPATPDEITKAEQRLSVRLPEDYIAFLKVTNGFAAPNQIEPSFLPIHKIDYLKNIDPFVIEAYKIEELENCIVIGGIDEEQQFFLLPPIDSESKWRYWGFANWFPGEHEFENLETYFAYVFDFMDKIE